MKKDGLYDIEYEDTGCWYHNKCQTCPFDDCIISDTQKPLGYNQVRALKKQYPELKRHKVAALQYGKVVMI